MAPVLFTHIMPSAGVVTTRPGTWGCDREVPSVPCSWNKELSLGLELLPVHPDGGMRTGHGATGGTSAMAAAIAKVWGGCPAMRLC